LGLLVGTIRDSAEHCPAEQALVTEQKEDQTLLEVVVETIQEKVDVVEVLVPGSPLWFASMEDQIQVALAAAMKKCGADQMIKSGEISIEEGRDFYWGSLASQ
jgi:hypothetical protein